MEIQFKTAQQHAIADLLWTADSEGQVAEIIHQYGQVAVVVREMMIAAAFDEVNDLTDAQHVLGKF